MSIKYLEFTVQEGLEIQRKQLLEWKLILNRKTYSALAAECKKRNQLNLKTGSDVFRGTDMNNFVHNLYNQ
jgi:hypothetical protein